MTDTQTTRAPVIDVSGLSHTYVAKGMTHHAIDDVSFTISPGELVSIVGPSGTGKSTLLLCVAGLLKPTSGEMSVLGEPVRGVPGDLAIVFQDYSRSLFPWLRVGANIEFPLKATHVPRAERRARVQESLEAVGLADAFHRYPWQLSGGMQQRVAIARALACRPKVLLMDEPFASVDAQTRIDLEDLTLAVRNLFDVTVLFVTHDIDESVYISDRVIALTRPPATVAADIPVALPTPRDQIATRATADFVKLRTEVANHLRRPESPGSPRRGPAPFDPASLGSKE
ncbi:ABC transporter ATP-binding protein [Streptomyces sp. NPDC048297]|uniref:ABC transporter ATP-binding protein n=1 Tax=Streptomyces sp. NPDC048297 TaxID=3365531 RepID=UPI00371A9023